jgi:hypothetical protein
MKTGLVGFRSFAKTAFRRRFGVLTEHQAAERG